MIPAEFNSIELPAIAKWAMDKVNHTSRTDDFDGTTVDVDSWTFSGGFNSRRAPASFYGYKQMDNGSEYHVTVNVIPAKYRGDKAQVSVQFNRYIPH